MAQKTKGRFVMIDGIDGSGKGTLVQALALHLWRKKARGSMMECDLFI